MKWPTHTDYQDAIQNPLSCFQEPDLKAGTITSDMLGLPKVMSGNFASVYELQTAKGKSAIRCFVRQVFGQQGRYARLGEYLANVHLDSLVQFEFLQKGILVHGEWYPIIRMEWVSGLQLNSYVDTHAGEPDTLKKLAADWRVMMRGLQQSKIAHGDLQHGNVMVTQDGQLRLVDYDGMYCPSFGRGKSPELGHANFQHPRRAPDYYEERLDNFAALVVHTSLLALAAEPALWDAFYTGDNLLFSAEDFKNTHQSNLFKRLKENPDLKVRLLADLLRECCIAPIQATPWYEDVLIALEENRMPSIMQAVVDYGKISGTQSAGIPVKTESKNGVPSQGAKSQSSEEVTSTGTRISPQSQFSTPTTAPTSPSTGLPVEETKSSLLPVVLAALALVLVVVIGFVMNSKKGKSTSPIPSEDVASENASQTQPPPEPSKSNPVVPVVDAQSKQSSSFVVARSFYNMPSAAGSLAWAPDTSMLAAGFDDGSLWAWNINGQLKGQWRGGADPIRQAVWVSTTNLITVDASNGLKSWSLGKDAGVKMPLNNGKLPWLSVLSPDGRSLAIGSSSDRKALRLVDPQTGTVRRMMPSHSSWIRGVSFSATGSHLTVLGWDDSVKVWNLTSNQGSTIFNTSSNVMDVVVASPDGRWVASSAPDFTVRIWDAQNGTPKQTLKGAGGDIKTVAWLPNSQYILAGSADKVLRVWDIPNGVLKASITNHSAAVSVVSAAPGKNLASSGSADKTIHLYNLQ